MSNSREVAATPLEPTGLKTDSRTSTRPIRGVIARQLAVSFGVVAFLSIFFCVMQCILIHEGTQLLFRMQEMEARIQGGYVVAASVREEYMHQAHWIIERDDKHLAESQEAAERVQRGLATLSPGSEQSQRAQFEALAKNSRELTRMFSEEVMPAVIANDLTSLKRYHIALNRHSTLLMEEADRIAESTEKQMSEMHQKALEKSHLGMGATVLCITSVFLASWFFVLRLRATVVKPVKELVEAARGVAQGHFEVRVVASGNGELGELAGAFNHMAEALSTRERRLIQGERMAAIGQLATGVAHEINNPIGIIRGYLKTMSPSSPPDQLESEIRILDEEAGACQRLANDLLDFSRTSEIRLADVDMLRLLSETVERFLGTEEVRGRKITTEVHPGAVTADTGRIRQVILNLIRNAVQASTADSPVEVSGQPSPEGGYVFLVADRGSGISQADRERVFEPFFSRNPKGSGLGLAVSQGIVRAHGGSISILAREGGGTIVKVVLPNHPPLPLRAP